MKLFLSFFNVRRFQSGLNLLNFSNFAHTDKLKHHLFFTHHRTKTQIKKKLQPHLLVYNLFLSQTTFFFFLNLWFNLWVLCTNTPTYTHTQSCPFQALGCSDVWLFFFADGRDVEALERAGGRASVRAGVPGNTGRCLSSQTREPGWRRSSRRAGQVLHRPETLHQPHHQAEVGTHTQTNNLGQNTGSTPEVAGP